MFIHYKGKKKESYVQIPYNSTEPKIKSQNHIKYQQICSCQSLYLFINLFLSSSDHWWRHRVQTRSSRGRKNTNTTNITLKHFSNNTNISLWLITADSRSVVWFSRSLRHVCSESKPVYHLCSSLSRKKRDSNLLSRTSVVNQRNRVRADSRDVNESELGRKYELISICLPYNKVNNWFTNVTRLKPFLGNISQTLKWTAVHLKKTCTYLVFIQSYFTSDFSFCFKDAFFGLFDYSEENTGKYYIINVQYVFC